MSYVQRVLQPGERPARISSERAIVVPSTGARYRMMDAATLYVVLTLADGTMRTAFAQES